MSDANTTPRPAGPRSTCVFRKANEGGDEGEVFLPQGLANGPWYPGTQHGSAMLGLLARAVEVHPSEEPMQVVRFNADLMRAAPMAPVRTTVRTYRRSRNVEILEASLLSEGKEYARASAMRFIVNPVAIPGELKGEAPRLSLPPPLPKRSMDQGENDQEAFHQSLEIRPVPGFELPVMWIRMRVPLVEGEEPSPVVRVAVASDFTYSVPAMAKIMTDPAAYMDESFNAINPDTGFLLHRPLRGEWVALHTGVFYGDEGAGSAHAQLHDLHGVLGHSTQCLLVRNANKPAHWNDIIKSDPHTDA